MTYDMPSVIPLREMPLLKVLYVLYLLRGLDPGRLQSPSSTASLSMFIDTCARHSTTQLMS